MSVLFPLLIYMSFLVGRLEGPGIFTCVFLLTLDSIRLCWNGKLGVFHQRIRGWINAYINSPCFMVGKIIITMQTGGVPWFAWKWSAATVISVLAGPNIYVVICCNHMWPEEYHWPHRDHFYYFLQYFLLLPHSTKKKVQVNNERSKKRRELRIFLQTRKIPTEPRLPNKWANNQLWKEIRWKERAKIEGKGKGKSKRRNWKLT